MTRSAAGIWTTIVPPADILQSTVNERRSINRSCAATSMCEDGCSEAPSGGDWFVDALLRAPCARVLPYSTRTPWNGSVLPCGSRVAH